MADRPSLALASARLAGKMIPALGVALATPPPAVRYAMGDALGLVMWLFGGPRRRDTATNMARLVGASPDDPRMRVLARRAFKSFGRMSIDFFALTSVSDAEILKRVDVAGYAHVDQ